MTQIVKEWIVTNGLGGYASQTHSGSITRKFHGLLIASLKPPTNRWVFVSDLNEKIRIKNQLYDLSNYGCRKFIFNMFPSFLCLLDNVQIKKTVFMPYKQNTTIIKYSIKTNQPISLHYTPVINSRHFYDLTEKHSISFEQKTIKNGINIRPNNINKNLKIILQDFNYRENNSWIEIHYKKDMERHDSWVDNGFIPGEFYKEITQSCEYYIILTVEDNVDNLNPDTTYSGEIQRKKSLLKKTGLPSKFDKLVLSTDNFIVQRDDKKTVIAGYHWFSDWSRDTLIALPGITLVTGRHDIAKQILLGLKDFCKNGLIPNMFPDREDSEVAYNTVDASLWYIDRVFQYLKYTDDQQLLVDIWGTLQSIVEYYKNGTNHGIHMDNDFLICHGPGLTWMDVKINDYYPTPRDKKAVEIQALWYNALKIMSILADIYGNDDLYSDLADNVKKSFNAQFDRQYDVIDTRDQSFRPNQILLVSLDFPMINRRLQKNIVDTVEEKLVTAFGLKTLSSDDPRYMGSYIGEYNKDLAYHNGTIWPWLLGQFIKAFIKTKDGRGEWREYAYNTFLKPMLTMFGENWDGSIPEIYDGDPPHTPRGCITQAWSVAEIFRAWVEDIEGITPKYEKKYFLYAHRK